MCITDVLNFVFQIQQCPSDASLSSTLVENLTPYLLEAGIDVELLHSNKEIVLQGLLLFFVIEKRKLELDDISFGGYIQYISHVICKGVVRLCTYVCVCKGKGVCVGACVSCPAKEHLSYCLY